MCETNQVLLQIFFRLMIPLLIWHRRTQNTVKLEFVPCPSAIIPFTPPSSQLINENPTLKCEYAIELLCKSLETSVLYQLYPQNILRIYDSHFVPILTLRTDNSGIVPCKVRILTLSAILGILTLRRAIPELSRFSLWAEHIYIYIYIIYIYTYSKTCLKRPLKKEDKNWFSR